MTDKRYVVIWRDVDHDPSSYILACPIMFHTREAARSHASSLARKRRLPKKLAAIVVEGALEEWLAASEHPAEYIAVRVTTIGSAQFIFWGAAGPETINRYMRVVAGREPSEHCELVAGLWQTLRHAGDLSKLVFGDDSAFAPLEVEP